MNKKILVAMPLAACIIISAFAAIWFNARGQPPTDCTIRLVPSASDIEACTNFVVHVNIENHFEFAAHDYEFTLGYDDTQVSPITAYDGGFLQSPVIFNWDGSNPGLVFCQAVTEDGGSTGSGTLASVEFHCDAPGLAAFDTPTIYISDYLGQPFVPLTIIPAFVNQIEAPAHVWIDPPDYTVPTSIPFSINVMVDVPAGKELYAFDLALSYNTAYVDCINIVDGGMLPPPTAELHKLIDDAAGKIEFNMTSTAPGGGATGTGSIAKITFHCTGAGLSILALDTVVLYDPAGLQIPAVTADGRVVQIGYWEPLKLQHLVELPYSYHLTDLPFVPPASPEGYLEVKAELEAKGYVFDVAYGGGLYHIDSFFDVYFEPGSEPFEGQVASWWSSNTLEDGTRACLLSAEMEDGSSMAMGFVTNLLPPEQIPEVDPYIIVNAQPYLFVRFYWWAWAPLNRVVTWSYWWYDSHSHPNWFWKPYYWWRTYTKSYYYPYTVVPYWRPWWSWWWHWLYWKHWNWWCTYFPYDP